MKKWKSLLKTEVCKSLYDLPPKKRIYSKYFKSSLKFKIKELKVFSKKPYFSVRKEREIGRNCCHLWKSLM